MAINAKMPLLASSGVYRSRAHPNTFGPDAFFLLDPAPLDAPLDLLPPALLLLPPLVEAVSPTGT